MFYIKNLVVKFTSNRSCFEIGDHQGCPGDTWYLEMEEPTIEHQLNCSMARDRVECKVPYGGVLLFSNALVHRSTENKSDMIRWSMDLRWQDPRKTMVRATPDATNRMPLMRSAEGDVGEVDWTVLDDGASWQSIHHNDDGGRAFLFVFV